eukprot:scaffold15248_cov115-Isochrysis_galbana.AAC.1
MWRSWRRERLLVGQCIGWGCGANDSNVNSLSSGGCEGVPGKGIDLAVGGRVNAIFAFGEGVVELVSGEWLNYGAEDAVVAFLVL